LSTRIFFDIDLIIHILDFKNILPPSWES